MKFYIKQKVFSIGDKFTVYDENGNDAYYVEGEFFTLGRKFHLLSTLGYELSYIEQKLFSFLPKYYIFRKMSERPHSGRAAAAHRTESIF